MKDCSFYASLRTKPALIENNTIKDNKNGDSNTITIANNEIDMNKELSELDNQEVDFDGSSFNNFLQEIEDDYKICGTQLRTAFDKFAERYKAAKSQSIGRVTFFLYDYRYNLDPLARIKSGAMIRVQPKSVKRRRQTLNKELMQIKRMITKKFPNVKCGK
ncbi:16348_t:CDS:2 [Gigaspora rosea]|nr:16348_t:CDS:2 [Gigaspora rosea]